MINAIQEYLQYLHNVKKTSRNTEISYERDLRKAEVYFKEQKITEPSQITSTNLNSYMLYLERESCRRPRFHGVSRRSVLFFSIW